MPVVTHSLRKIMGGSVPPASDIALANYVSGLKERGDMCKMKHPRRVNYDYQGVVEGQTPGGVLGAEVDK
jgi:hypothetical protein